MLSLILLSEPAVAQPQSDCPEDLGRGPREITPADGAAAVTLDAVVRVGYTPGFFAEPGRDPADFLEVYARDSVEQLVGDFQVVGGDTVFFIPEMLLEAESMYHGLARGIDGDLEFSFRTGRTLDERAPTLGPIARVDATEIEAGCEAPDGGYRVDVHFPPAADDGPPGSIEYLLYLSRFAGQGAPSIRARARGYSTRLITMAFVLSQDEAVEPICVEVVAVDGVGRVSEVGETTCLDPLTGSFFAGLCSVSPHGNSTSLAVVAFVACLTLIRRRRGWRRDRGHESP